MNRTVRKSRFQAITQDLIVLFRLSAGFPGYVRGKWADLPTWHCTSRDYHLHVIIHVT